MTDFEPTDLAALMAEHQRAVWSLAAAYAPNFVASADDVLLALSICRKIADDPGGHVTDSAIDVRVELTDAETAYLHSLDPDR